jgi:hypothetical protein
MFKRVCRVAALFVFADGVQAAQIAADPPAALPRTDSVRIGPYQSEAGRQDSAVFTPGYAGLRMQYEVRY